MRTVCCCSPAEMHALGVRLGQRAQAGVVVALAGTLGAGKTVLAQGMGEGLGVTGLITSPTFVLLVLHESGRLPFVHADLYRLGNGDEATCIGLPEFLGSQAVAVVEWADRFPEILPQDRLDVRIDLVPYAPQERVVHLCATGPNHVALEACADE